MTMVGDALGLSHRWRRRCWRFSVEMTTTQAVLCYLGTFLLLLLVSALCSMITSPGAAAILNPDDFLALQAIRGALRDMPGSVFLASWDFATDPCTFPGVLCSGGRIVALYLGDPRAGSSGIFGHIDPAIGTLSALTELSLVRGHVTGQIPPAISQLSELRFLVLSRNFLSGSIPPENGELRQLRILDLGFSQLDGPIPPGLVSIATLSTLVLCYNSLSGAVPPFPHYPSTMARLDLRHNDFTGVLPTLPSSLQYLSLSQNGLTGPVDEVLPRLVRLNYLDLSMNDFSGIMPPRVFSFSIVDLRLQRNNFSGPVQPEEMVAIPEVDLSYNQLSGEISPLFAGTQRLYLNNNKLTGEVPASLVREVLEGAMQVLYLQHNYLTGIQIDPSAQMPVGSLLCLPYNCMVPPPQTSCPLNVGQGKSRPAAQCSLGGDET